MHLSFPMRLNGGQIVTDEQDSIDEIQSCVHLLLETPVGSREESPEFGTDRLEFEEAPLDTQTIASQIERWEPRTVTSFHQFYDDLEQGVLDLDLIIDKRIENAS